MIASVHEVVASAELAQPELMKVSELGVRFGEHAAVAAANLSIVRGEIVGLVGESGSGKTMLGRALLDLLPPTAVRTGEIRFEGRSLDDLTPEDLRRLRGAAIGMVFQEPLTSLNPALTIGRQMTEAQILHHSIDCREAEGRAVAMLSRVGFTQPGNLLERHPHEFSGGMRQRIMIAAVMLLRPKLVVADEPTTALDSINQQEVLKLLVELTREAGTAVLLVSHDLGLVASYADRLIVMQSGRVVEQGTCASILAAPREAYTRTLLESVPRRRELSAGAHAQRQDAVRLDGIKIAYPAKAHLWRRAALVPAVHGVDVRVATGETVGLVGQSGSGKTSIARAIIGLVKPAGGRILIDGVDLASLSRRDPRRRAIGMVFQDPFSSLDPRMRIGQIVAEPTRGMRGVQKADVQHRVRRLLDDVGLGADFEQRFPHQLSGGQRQRVAIARALVAEPRLLIADEPCAALDVTVQAQILRLLRSLQATHGFGCLFISHDLAVIEEIAHRVVVLHRGSIVEEGDCNVVLTRPRHPYTRRLVQSFPQLIAKQGGFEVARRILPPQAPEDDARYADFDVASGGPLVLTEVEPGHRVALN